MHPTPPQRRAMTGETFRDRWGIPHLRAGSADELAFLQGTNAATDRSWQIEMERWRSEGRTAENLGAEGLPWDRFARQSRIDDTARRCFANLDAGTQHWCTAYVAGINHTLESGRRDAREFRETATAPAAWKPWTPLGVFLVHHILFSTFPNKLWRAHVAATLGVEAVELFSIEAPVWAGSNAWAAAGSLTASGSPLIAGDPHRLMEVPGVYQQVRLACPEFDVVGLAFPGVPGLPHFGHAGTAAWAVTNAMADYQDLYIEKFRHDGGALQALGPDGWETVPVNHQEEILVRGAGAETVDVIETARGPVITGWPATVKSPAASGAEMACSGHDSVPLSLRMTSRSIGSLGFEALLPLLRSRSAGEVEAALAPWVEPVNSVLAADSRGDVRRLVAGKVPARNRQNRVLPVPAWSAGHQWTGEWVDLPRTAVDALAVCANDRAAGGGDLIGMEFAPPHRARRIKQLLEDAGPELNADDMQRIHMDTQLGAWPALRALLQNAVGEHATEPFPLSSPALELRQRLLEWSGHMHAHSIAAGAFAAWRSALVRALAASPRLAPLSEATGHSSLFELWLSPVARVGFALETILAKGADHGVDLQAAARQALEAAAAAPSSGPWGDSHRVLPLHALSDHPSAGAAAPPVQPASLSGDTGCVLATESVPGVTDGSFRGPVARYVWDLSERAASRWIVPFGASGHPDDGDFLSQLPLWCAGDLIPVVTDWEQLTKENGDHT